MPKNTNKVCKTRSFKYYFSPPLSNCLTHVKVKIKSKVNKTKYFIFT